MALPAGTRLGPYEILAPVGAGGMGQVYRARDPRLGREVAIKILHAEYSDRLQSEARAIAALNHPHICSIYDIGPDYLVMEYIEGVPLKGPLPKKEALRLGTQIGQALEAAHARGITHRDLKPANILVTASGVKLLDFGLAKLTVPEDSEATASVAGAVMGTVGYMSPEQVRGWPADARSDIFSYGMVFYEMLSGQRPFPGDNAIATMAAILHKEPRPLEADIELQAIVTRCLRKLPGERFQSATELLRALESGAKAAGTMPSIAVLPFANMSREPDDDYFSDGLAEEIINALAHVPGLKVIARTSAFAFKGKNEDIRKIAETLGVSNILEGSVRRAGNRLRVTAQLIHAQDGTHLWSQRYDRELTDVFAVQDEIAAAIAAALEVRLSLAPEALRRYTPNLPAYEAYLKARHHWAKNSPEALMRSKEYYEESIRLDPEFALAHIGLAEYFLLLTFGGLLPAHDAMPLVRASARKALELDYQLPEAHAMLGVVAAVYDYDWRDAEQLFGVAMAHDPVAPQVHGYFGYFYLLPMGRPEDAVEEIRRALMGDPLNLMARVLLGDALRAAGRIEGSSAEYRRVLELDENSWWAYVLLGWNHMFQGMNAEALPLTEKGHSLAPWNAIARAVFSAALRQNGNTSRAEDMLLKLRNVPDAYGTPRGLATFHFLCAEIDLAADWAERSLEQRDPGIPMLLASAPFRSSARWPALAKLLNLPG
jgi:serine/threonine protein kinase